LAISNILRGLSFLPGNEDMMAQHAGLLYIVGRLLRLYTDEMVSKLAERSLAKHITQLQESMPLPLEPGAVSEATRRFMLPGDLLEPDDDDALLLFETANQLREDAFVIMAHISVQLDAIDLDSDVAWPLFDSLIHWNYALETLCKMSVIEHNVDLLLSTGPWSRFEKFVKILVELLALSEDIPSREFAIVILHALCSASDQVCYVVAAESPAIDNLVAFLEMGDANMHQIAQQHGIQALRENPEVMGTSVPMLRRSASILQQLCRMDSKVGQIITEVLFAMQLAEQSEAESSSKSSNNKNAEKEKQSIQEEASSEQKSADTAQKSSEKTNGDTTPSKGDSQGSTDTVEQPQNTRKRPAAHNGVPKGMVYSFAPLSC
uniref:BAF250_C domain-containing protein n=1 Tax=Gongylonema pulchrum TaxID=637853 RepID=A0A183E2M0_9BILA